MSPKRKEKKRERRRVVVNRNEEEEEEVCYGWMIDGYRGNVNSSVYFIFISMVFIIFAAEDGMRWVGNKRFHSRFTLGETGYPLFEERSSSRYFIFFYSIVSFFFRSNIKLYRSSQFKSSRRIQFIVYLLYIYIYGLDRIRRKSWWYPERLEILFEILFGITT